MDPELAKRIKFNGLLNALLRRFLVSDQEYVKHILPHIPASQLWCAELAEREIKSYLLNGRKRIDGATESQG